MKSFLNQKSLFIPRLFVATITFIASLPVFATGGGLGNGGDAIVCRDRNGHITSAELLDYFEARVLRDLNPEFGNESQSPDQRALVAVERLERRAPEAFRILREYVVSFLSETRMISDIDLPDVPDSGEVLVPRGCRVEQVAIQHEPRVTRDYRYWINQEIWNAMSRLSRAGLILHEVIYRVALQVGATNSIGVRHLNALMSSPEFDHISREEYTRAVIWAFQNNMVASFVSPILLNLPITGPNFIYTLIDPRQSRIYYAVVTGPELIDMEHFYLLGRAGTEAQHRYLTPNQPYVIDSEDCNGRAVGVGIYARVRDYSRESGPFREFEFRLYDAQGQLIQRENSSLAPRGQGVLNTFLFTELARICR